MIFVMRKIARTLVLAVFAAAFPCHAELLMPEGLYRIHLEDSAPSPQIPRSNDADSMTVLRSAVSGKVSVVFAVSRFGMALNTFSNVQFDAKTLLLTGVQAGPTWGPPVPPTAMLSLRLDEKSGHYAGTLSEARSAGTTHVKAEPVQILPALRPNAPGPAGLEGVYDATVVGLKGQMVIKKFPNGTSSAVFINRDPGIELSYQIGLTSYDPVNETLELTHESFYDSSTNTKLLLKKDGADSWTGFAMTGKGTTYEVHLLRTGDVAPMEEAPS